MRTAREELSWLFKLGEKKYFKKKDARAKKHSILTCHDFHFIIKLFFRRRIVVKLRSIIFFYKKNMCKNNANKRMSKQSQLNPNQGRSYSNLETFITVWVLKN